MTVGANPKGNIPYRLPKNTNKNNTNKKGPYTKPLALSAYLQY